MPYKPSRCICIETPRQREAVEFYTKVLGLRVRADNDISVELAADPIRLFVDKRAHSLIVFELLVPDVEAAREDLVAKGCTVVRWEGSGRACYLRDPFGLVFNLYEVEWPR